MEQEAYALDARDRRARPAHRGSRGGAGRKEGGWELRGRKTGSGEQWGGEENGDVGGEGDDGGGWCHVRAKLQRRRHSFPLCGYTFVGDKGGDDGGIGNHGKGIPLL